LEKPWLNFYDSGVPSHIDYPDIILTSFLRQSAKKYPDRPCTVFRNQTISFAEMDELTDILANGLKSLGLAKGDRVGVLLPNIPQFVLVFYAILKAGGVVVALNPQYKQRELEYQINDSNLKILIALDELSDLVEQLRKDISPLELIFSKTEDAFQLKELLSLSLGAEPKIQISENRWLLEFLAFSKSLNDPINEPLPDDVAIFQYSGGTTGTPKAAIGSHRNLVSNTIQFRRWLVGLEDGKEIVLAAIPLYHVYGMVIAMSLGISLGATLVLIPNPRNLDDILDNIARYKATLFPGVPNIYQAISRHPDVTSGKVVLSSIKACISGSAPLLVETKERFEALTGGKLMEGYGLSEAPTATHCNPMFGINKAGSIGLPLPDVDCRIVDLEDPSKNTRVGERGELVIKGPQIMRGYHQRPEEDKITLIDGWLYTGDIAWMDEDGYFFLVDRKKDLIKIGGFQVWPREIEEVISMHPDVKEVAVSGVLDAQKEEMVKAWVVTSKESKLNSEEIISWCKQYLANYKVPTEVVFREDLPRTSVGKILRRELRRLHEEDLA
jgi:long-chain acyl-CoA synthetase